MMEFVRNVMMYTGGLVWIVVGVLAVLALWGIVVFEKAPNDESHP